MIRRDLPARAAGSTDRDPLVEDLAGAVSSRSDVDFAYLFGSIAKGRARGASDVDVAVHLGEGRSASERLDRALELEGVLERECRREVQVVVLNDAPLDLRYNVLAHGIPLLVNDDAARRSFYVDTGRRYYDMAPARALFRRRQAERIREGRFGG